MPTSNLAVAPAVLHMIFQVHHKGGTILDIGPGWGKYATLIREYVDPAATIVGLEAWKPYITKHRLDRLYDPIIHGDARTLSEEFYSRFDVVLMADVIEHMPKEDAWALISKIRGFVVISTPRDFFHNGYGHPKTEDHISHWTVDDFRASTRFDTHNAGLVDELGCVLVRLKRR